ncbi:DeoR family transcriptional regulator [Bifidobacterium goeldii]|uniref:DeoR family transcriptional regulator n=1 Tax=Bifidobacterium goeldii TaxID=2306975 RepID=A0A430FLR4_9BIFI|nr:diacylglycerol kinase family protein [Bifidobacterium goeldii]RSX53632.1 DeoR family transcriptional regulator [Bifidobacterium goeldii]
MTDVKKTVAVIGNPASNKGRGAAIGERVFKSLSESGMRHGFDVIDLTGDSFENSLSAARAHSDLYDYLVVIGGDGMIALGANAVCGTGKPLGIVAVGSGNDFARGLHLPVNRIRTAVEGIVGAIVCGTHIDVDMGHVRSLNMEPVVQGGSGELVLTEAGNPVEGFVDRYYAGMLNCGLDASINDRANKSHLPGGSVRYAAAVLVELTHMKRYGYHIKAVLADGSVDERDIISPLVTVANARYIGGGIEVSPYSLLSDGMLDLIWIDHMPSVAECAAAVSDAYNGKLLSNRVFGWERVREIEITRADDGDEPPVLMADGEYVGRVPVSVSAAGMSLRMLVPPAVAGWHKRRTQEHVTAAIMRDGRDPITGRFVEA